MNAISIQTHILYVTFKQFHGIGPDVSSKTSIPEPAVYWETEYI